MPEYPAGAAVTLSALTPANYPLWRRALGRVRAGTGNAKVLCIGDSIIAGAGAGAGAGALGPGGNSAPSRLQAMANSYLAPAALGFSNAYNNTSTDNRWALGAGWVGSNGYGMSLLGCLQAAAGTVTDTTFTPGINCDTFDVYYVQLPGFGTFQSHIDAAANTPVNTSGALSIQKVTLSAAASTTHVLHITGVTVYYVYIVGVDAYLSTAPSIRIGCGAVGGTSALAWADGLQNGVSNLNATTGSLASIQAYAPDLTVVFLGGVNDGAYSNTLAQFQTSIAALVAAAKVSGDVMLTTSIPSQPSGQPLAAGFEAAAAPWLVTYGRAQNVGVIDLYGRWQSYAASQPNGYYSDTVHPSVQGYTDMAIAVLDALQAAA